MKTITFLGIGIYLNIARLAYAHEDRTASRETGTQSVLNVLLTAKMYAQYVPELAALIHKLIYQSEVGSIKGVYL